MIKILGIGSPFGNDQLGWQVALLLKERASLQPYLSKNSPSEEIFLYIDLLDRPGVRLLKAMENADTVYLIDAVVSGKPIGTQYRFQNETLMEMNGRLSSHDLGIAEVIQLGKVLNILPSDIVFFGLEIDPFNDLSNLSFPIQQALTPFADCIENEVLEKLRKLCLKIVSP